MSDEVITEKCGILDLIEKGDNIIMVHRCFEIKELLSWKERQEVDSYRDGGTRHIAESWIHVERAIGKANNYLILSNVISIL